MLIEWNAKMNLTAITAPEEVAQKHFLDSVLPVVANKPRDAEDSVPYMISKGSNCIDVGTGAGFPGVPLMIMRPDIKMTLLDSLNKRLIFLRELCNALGLKAEIIHARAEDAGQDTNLRGKFDIALSRALAPARVCAELTVPLLRVGGMSLMYKGAKAHEELAEAQGALSSLRCKGKIVKFPASWGERNIIVVKKIAPTPDVYPRKRIR